MPLILYKKGPEAWARAVAWHREGRPRLLLRLLAGDDPLPTSAREYLAALVEKSTKAPKGRPAKRSIQAFAETWLIADFYRVVYAAAKAAGTRPFSGAAMHATMEKFHVSESGIKRALKQFPA